MDKVECARMGCPARATVMLAYDPRSATAWLRDLIDAHPSLGLALCAEHAERTSVPMGWSRIDERRPAWQSFDSEDPFAAEPVDVFFDRDDVRFGESQAARPQPSGFEPTPEVAAGELDPVAPAPVEAAAADETDGREFDAADQSFAARSRERLRRIEEMAFRAQEDAADPASAGSERFGSASARADDFSTGAVPTPELDPRARTFDGVESEDIEDEDFDQIFGITPNDHEITEEARTIASDPSVEDTDETDSAVAASDATEITDITETADAEDLAEDPVEDPEPEVPAASNPPPAPRRRPVDEYDEANVSFDDIFPSLVSGPDKQDRAGMDHGVTTDDGPPPIKRISRVERSATAENRDVDESLFPGQDFSSRPSAPGPRPVARTADPADSARSESARPDYLPTRSGASANLRVDGAVSPLLGRAFGFVQRHERP